MRDRWNSLILFLGAFAFYLTQAAPSVTAGDAGEFMTASGTLSLAHAPSFPLYMFLGRCFIELVPFATVAFRLNIFSALTSAGTLLTCYWIGRTMGSSRTVSVVVSILFGLTASFFDNSLVTEVFALNTFLASVLLLIMIKTILAEQERDVVRMLCVFAFVLGIGLGNHHILIFMAAGVVFLVWNHWFVFRLPVLRSIVLCGLLGFSIYATLPIRSMKNPPLNWGQPTSMNRLIRTITRKDYGPLRLAVGTSPERNWPNTQQHLMNFGRHMAGETTWPLLVLGELALLWGVLRRSRLSGLLIVLFLMAGPFFYVLGNLPFIGQSDGIMGRFYIMPVLFLIMAIHLFGPRLIFLTPVLLFLGTQQLRALEWDHRFSTIVLDYGRSMLRSLPPQAILFMDGGDDAFYSLAMLHYVEKQREDVTLHDRGGLVFRNPYGDDFRTLSGEEKKKRRQTIEKSYVGVRPLYYSTMDPDVLPGASLTQRGFLYEAGAAPEVLYDWPLVIIRSLYPLHPSDYRTRALGAFFPYMQGKAAWYQNDFGKTLSFFKRAQIMGFDVDWLRTNLGQDYAHFGYDSLMRGRYALAEWVYQQWIDFDPTSMQAQSNLGVTLEKLDKKEDAKAQYLKTAKMFPDATDAVFNLAVLSWQEKKWPEVVEYLEEVLRRNPNHLQARIHMEEAKRHMREDHP